MNDSMDLVADKNCVIKVYQELSILWGKNQRLSNSAKVLEKIPAKICANEVNFQKNIYHQ